MPLENWLHPCNGTDTSDDRSASRNHLQGLRTALHTSTVPRLLTHAQRLYVPNNNW
jgi:hypothetical protein